MWSQLQLQWHASHGIGAVLQEDLVAVRAEAAAARLRAGPKAADDRAPRPARWQLHSALRCWEPSRSPAAKGEICSDAVGSPPGARPPSGASRFFRVEIRSLEVGTAVGVAHRFGAIVQGRIPLRARCVLKVFGLPHPNRNA